MGGNCHGKIDQKDEMCIKIYIEIVKQKESYMYWWYEIVYQIWNIYIYISNIDGLVVMIMVKNCKECQFYWINVKWFVICCFGREWQTLNKNTWGRFLLLTIVFGEVDVKWLQFRYRKAHILHIISYLSGIRLIIKFLVRFGLREQKLLAMIITRWWISKKHCVSNATRHCRDLG